MILVMFETMLLEGEPGIGRESFPFGSGAKRVPFFVAIGHAFEAEHVGDVRQPLADESVSP